MNQRPDKYIVAHKVSVEVGEKELCRQIDAYGQEGVILGDLHSELRNRLLKYCYAKEIRVYLTPKLYYGTESGSAPYFRYTASARAKQWSFV